METRKDGTEVEIANRRTLDRRMSCTNMYGVEEITQSVNALAISKLNALRQSVDRHNNDIAKLLLSSKESLERRGHIEAAFRTCKEAFVEVSTMLMGSLEGNAVADGGIVEEVRKAVNDIMENRVREFRKDSDGSVAEAYERRRVGPVSYAAAVGCSDTKVHVSGGPVVEVPKTTSFLTLPKEGSEKNRYTSSQMTRDTVFKVLKPFDCALKINKIMMARNNGIRIEAVSSDMAVIKAHKELQRAGLKVMESTKYDPRIIIYGIPIGMSAEQIREEIISQNLEGDKNVDLKVIYIFPAKSDRHSTSCVVEISPQIRKVLMENGRIYLGYSACRFADHVRILQCYKCLGFGHVAGGCKAEPVCGHCAERHEMRECKSRELPPRCGNCLAQRGGSVADGAHAAVDAVRCPVLCRKIKDRVSNINYG